jgi:hypothetical protein
VHCCTQAPVVSFFQNNWPNTNARSNFFCNGVGLLDCSVPRQGDADACLSVCRAPSAAAQRVSCLARYLQRSLTCTTPASQPNRCTEAAKRASTKLEPRGGQILGSLVLQLLAIDPDPAESRSIESVHMYCSNHGPLASFPHSHTFPTSFLCVRPLNGIDAKGELVLPFSPAGGGSTRQRPGPVI